MSRRTTGYASASRIESRVLPGGVATDRSDVHTVAMVRDLPSNFFAVGRMNESGSYMVIDSKEVLDSPSGKSAAE